MAGSPIHFGRGDWGVAAGQVTEMIPPRQSVKVTVASQPAGGLSILFKHCEVETEREQEKQGCPPRREGEGEEDQGEERGSRRQQKGRDRVGGREQRCPALGFPGFAEHSNKAYYKRG